MRRRHNILLRLLTNLLILVATPLFSFVTHRIKYSRYGNAIKSGFKLNVLNETSSWYNEPPLGTNTGPRPIPSQPSDNFKTLCISQFELLSNSLTFPISEISKVKRIALYLPQENVFSGQLEFVPVLLFPTNERIFIANQAGTGISPSIPRTLTQLPGFSHAQTLLPQYPFISSSSSSGKNIQCGTVEEVFCELQEQNGSCALSVPLFEGSRTAGVILVWPSKEPAVSSLRDQPITSIWTTKDKTQISRVANGIAVALSMDMAKRESDMNLEMMQMQVENLRMALSENMHQVKNPLQALRTFGKLLQRRIAFEELLDNGNGRVSSISLKELADNLVIQSDRVVDLLLPVDNLIDSLEPGINRRNFYLDSINCTSAEIGLVLDNDFIQVLQSRQQQQDEQDLRKYDNTSNVTPRAVVNSNNLGDMNIQMTFLVDVIEPILLAESLVANENNIEFTIDGLDTLEDLPGVTICEKSFHQALSNVLENAIKYVVISNNNPKIRIRIEENSENDDTGVSIFVEDNGPGIPLKDREAVFKRGFRSDHTMNCVSGQGIGLDLCRAMIERMGGTIDILDPEEKGCVLNGAIFRIKLYRKPLKIQQKR